MPLITCPHCVREFVPPRRWTEPAILCPSCRTYVNPPERSREPTAFFITAVMFVSFFAGVAFLLAEAHAIDKIPKQLFPWTERVIAELLLVTLGGGFCFGRFLFWWFDRGSDNADLWAPLTILFAIGDIIAGVFLVVGGWRTLQTFLVLRPCLLFGMFLIGLALWDIWRSSKLIESWFSKPKKSSARKVRKRTPPASDVSAPNVTPTTYSGSLNQVMRLARAEAVAHQQDFIGIQHLLLAFTQLDGRLAREILAEAGVTGAKLEIALTWHLEPSAGELPAGELPITPAIRRAIEHADKLAQATGFVRAEAEHLLLALLADEDSVAGDAFVSLGLNLKALAESLAARTQLPPTPNVTPTTYSGSLNQVMRLARTEAVAHQQDFIGTQHLLLAFAYLETRPAGQALLTAGATVEKLRAALASHLVSSVDELPTGELPITPAIRRAIERADKQAQAAGFERAEAEHLLLALLADVYSVAVEALVSLGLNPKALAESLAAQPQLPPSL